MTVSKTEKVYLGVLAMALGALVIDRTFLGSSQVTPSQAAAQQAAPSPQPPQAAPVPPPGPDEPAAPESPALAARLREAAGAEKPDYANVRDVFALSQGWLAELESPATQPGTSAAKSVPARPVHKLMAVMVGGESSYAIIDGKCLLVGQEMDGLKLISVEQNSAVVEADGVRIQLPLQEQPQPAGAERISN
ncbi:MAG: hypothetical protein AMJ81_12905 [Phycisphaerae bacterium SM23_33]|jgi:hypothetical protein|nr:MAG: hypothetical protein AMJ81_12905 [Phycisphaerae bacterium SM23_33]